MNEKERMLVFAGAGKESGSGFENLARAARTGALEAEIAGVVSTRADGGVRARAERLGIPFIHFPPPWTAARYRRLVRSRQARFAVCVGWGRRVLGLDPGRTINFHPAPLPEFGGEGMFGRRLHEAVIAAYKCGALSHTALCAHFVTEQYDQGPVFFRLLIPILPCDTPETLERRVKELEYEWQPFVVNSVVTGAIRWSGRSENPVIMPAGYEPVVRLAP